MSEGSFSRRIQARLAFQEREDVKTGKELRHEAFYKLFEGHQDMDPEQFERWLELLEAEEAEPVNLNLSAGAAALIMMDVRESRKRTDSA